MNLILADCWDESKPLETLVAKAEETLVKLYAIIYSDEFRFDHMYPTRSSSSDSDTFRVRERLIKVQLAPLKAKQVPQAKASPSEYKPFNIAEMEIEMPQSQEAKQDEIMKMYQQLGLLF